MHSFNAFLKKEEKRFISQVVFDRKTWSYTLVYIWEKWDQLSQCQSNSGITDKFLYNVNVRLFLQFLNHNHNDRHISES